MFRERFETGKAAPLNRQETTLLQPLYVGQQVWHV